MTPVTRGLLRLWVVLAALWIGGVAFVVWQDWRRALFRGVRYFDLMRQNRTSMRKVSLNLIRPIGWFGGFVADESETTARPADGPRQHARARVLPCAKMSAARRNWERERAAAKSRGRATPLGGIRCEPCMSWFHSRDRTYTGRQYTAERGDGDISLVCQLRRRWQGGIRSQQLRLHIVPAVYGDALGQWGDLLSKSVVCAVSSPDDLCSTEKR
jgi:hypothetical protein